ncbi:hypothetical protein CC86DRAFT_338026 [Ophiobolus disseminans]|uniref:Box C/D snoRNA protein 1 n=1 Tax=Ophiobolus disseminans TaxID=1469910 RepID=A0A6A7AJU0_9PLEO|nr:hypothetical protein CC86DRAFT_338026 [Ophiobolus disseminans]
MGDETPLSDLCSICNINKSKYRCPGCSARTCSLPCYKRHQQWAQCSGQRDPTKFIKKSELVTSAGIDHDFNFLTSIERNIQKAEKAITEDNEDSSMPPKSWSQHSQKDHIIYQHLEATGVRIIRAPKGMSRQKENKSHRSSVKRSNGGKNVQWTVEWIDDQKRRVLTQTSSTCRITEAQPFAHREQHKGKKRKRNAGHPGTTSPPNHNDAKPTRETQNESIQLKPNQVVVQKGEHSPSYSNEEKDEESKTQLDDTHATSPCHDEPSSEPIRNREPRFCLIKPRTNSNRHVLIPLMSTATLGECLAGRTVLEFPTIYVFPSSPEQLPSEFMLEEDYLKQEGEDQKEFDELINELDPDVLRRLREDGQQHGDRMGKEARVDDKEILDVLKKDFGNVL